MSVLSPERRKRLRRVDVSGRFYGKVKRILDIIGALVALSVLALPLGILALIVYFDDPGPVIFAQERVGLGGKVFRLYKLRTMKQNAPAYLSTEEMDNPGQYVTKAGRILRKLSLDEIPQFMNVLKGDMSIVGPRPPLPREVEQYDDRARQRLIVQPGLTCYWQVQPYRNKLNFDEWIDLDIQYIKDRSFITDWKIIFRTIGAVFGMNGE
jgi:lipopolysaccharide/colanic/teichoic acid biosynthesis glycosyltransferase